MILGQYIGLFVLLFTSLVGIFTLARLLWTRILEKADMEKSVTLLPLHGREEQIEYLLRNLGEKEGQIIALDLGADQETLDIVRRFQLGKKKLSLLKKEELLSYLEDNVS